MVRFIYGPKGNVATSIFSEAIEKYRKSNKFVRKGEFQLGFSKLFLGEPAPCFCFYDE